VTTITPYRSPVQDGPDGFGQLLHAEWAKFRTVRGWVIAAAVAAALMVGFAVLGAAGSHSTYNTSPDGPEIVGHPPVPIGPSGIAVSDSFYFVHQSLAGDGTITGRVTALTGATLHLEPGGTPTPTSSTVQPWTKVGLIIKDSTKPGSAYAAMLVLSLIHLLRCRRSTLCRSR